MALTILSPVHQSLPYILAGVYLAWRMYRGFRKTVGRQKLKPPYIIIRLVVLCIASIAMCFLIFQSLNLLMGFGAGLLCGFILGFFGLRLTRFETTNEGHFYIPDTRMGVAISLLLAARIVYRLIQYHDVFTPGNPPPHPSPLTFFVIGLAVGYFIVYNGGLFVHAYDKKLI